jgi:hypothetical protein
LIAAERERLAALVEEECRKVIDWDKVDREPVRKIIAEVTDRISERIVAKLNELDQLTALGTRRSDDDG